MPKSLETTLTQEWNEPLIEPPSPRARARIRALGAGVQGLAWAATALLPVLAFVSMLRPGGPLRGTRSPDPVWLGTTPIGSPATTSALEIDFAQLDFSTRNQDRGDSSTFVLLEQAPAAIRQLDGRLVRITGFAVPIDAGDEPLHRCLMVRKPPDGLHPGSPRFCEFILVRMRKDMPGGRLLATQAPVSFTGTLHVGDADAAATGMAFYTLDCIETGP